MAFHCARTDTVSPNRIAPHCFGLCTRLEKSNAMGTMDHADLCCRRSISPNASNGNHSSTPFCFHTIIRYTFLCSVEHTRILYQHPKRHVLPDHSWPSHLWWIYRENMEASAYMEAKPIQTTHTRIWNKWFWIDRHIRKYSTKTVDHNPFWTRTKRIITPLVHPQYQPQRFELLLPLYSSTNASTHFSLQQQILLCAYNPHPRDAQSHSPR